MRRRSVVVRLVLVALFGAAAGAACTKAEHTSDGDGGVDLPRRTEPDASDDPIDSAVADDVVDASIDEPDGAPCGTLDGGVVYCVSRGVPFVARGTLTYGPGFNGSQPAMGLGRPSVGYIPPGYPFTCVATNGTGAVGSPNNAANGKTCEAHFDNSNSGTAMGMATYAVTADGDAGAGTYSFGLTANPGTTIAEPTFYLRLAAP